MSEIDDALRSLDTQAKQQAEKNAFIARYKYIPQTVLTLAFPDVVRDFWERGVRSEQEGFIVKGLNGDVLFKNLSESIRQADAFVERQMFWPEGRPTYGRRYAGKFKDAKRNAELERDREHQQVANVRADGKRVEVLELAVESKWSDGGTDRVDLIVGTDLCAEPWPPRFSTTSGADDKDREKFTNALALILRSK